MAMTWCVSAWWSTAPAGSRILVHELMLKLLHGIASWMIARKIPPITLECAYPQPAHSADYRYFYPGRLLFDRPQTAIYFDLAVPRRADPPDQAAPGRLPAARPGGLVLRLLRGAPALTPVREHLTRHGAYAAGVAEVAAALHMSVRTLSRRLATEGTRFQAVKDECRRDVAVQALTRSDQPLAGIAERLGFEDQARFSRAFRAWTGDYARRSTGGRARPISPDGFASCRACPRWSWGSRRPGAPGRAAPSG